MFQPRLVFIILALQSAWALNPHPRIWLDSALKTTLSAKKNANDADWLALKSQADTWATWTVDAFNRDNCAGTGHICYTYEGSGWYNSMLTLALAYQVTGNTSYAAKAKEILTAANAPYKNSGDISPITLDVGYPTRHVLVALAIGYDWLYDYLDATTKTDTINTINAAYTWFSTNAAPAPYVGNIYGNYFGGHILGFGLAAVATDGDNSTAPTIYTYFKNILDGQMPLALQAEPETYSSSYGGFATGGFLGGGIPESYGYGTAHLARMWQLLLAWKTSGQVDLITTTYAQWLKNSAKNMEYVLRPNMWRAGDEGDMAGDCTGVLSAESPLFLAYLLNGTPEGEWAEYLSRNIVTNPCLSAYSTISEVGAVLWKDSARTSTNYGATLGTAYYSEGDGHLFSRSDWTTSAVHTSFNGSAAQYIDHMNRTAGNLEISRGTDYMVVDSAQWKTLNGYGPGSPSIFQTYSSYASTLFFNDGGAYLYAYAGGQAVWGQTSVLAKVANANIAYALADLGTTYDRRQDSRVPANRTSRYYYRAVAHLGGGTIFVWDRFRASSSSYTKRLQWHLNPANAPTVNGSIISSVIGLSKVFINTVLPASPAIVVARDLANDGVTPLTYNMQVSDSALGTDLNVLTVIYATAANGSAPPVSTIATDVNWVGAQVADSTPFVAVFAKTIQDNGNNTYAPLTYGSTTFTSTHSGTGKYLVAGLSAGTYSVVRNGAVLLTNAAVGSDGTLSFAAQSGDFSIARQGGASSPCDLNGDGVVNIVDVQIAVNQMTGAVVCSNADLDGNGTCNIVDLQRIVNAALGLACKVGS